MVGHSIDVWDARAALVALARGVMKRAAARRPERSWFVLWPAIPEPALYDAVAEACAA